MHTWRERAWLKVESDSVPVRTIWPSMAREMAYECTQSVHDCGLSYLGAPKLRG